MAGWHGGNKTTILDGTKPGVTAFGKDNKPVEVTRVIATDKAIREAQSNPGKRSK